MGATNGRARVRDVYRSDFVQDSGTPLQWAIAWETIAERERAARDLAALVYLCWLVVLAAARP